MDKLSHKRSHRTAVWTPKRNYMTPCARVGRSAENLTVFYLMAHGWTIHGRNYETLRGEIDIIAYKMDADLRGYPTFSFIEVKARTNVHGLAPEMNVTLSKQRKFTSAVRYWIGTHAHLKAVYRCDIAALVIPPKGMPHIRYIPNAFNIKAPFGW